MKKMVILFCSVLGTLLSEVDMITPYLKFLGEHRNTLGTKGDYKKGEIEIIEDPKEIKEVETLQKMRYINLGLSEMEAKDASRVGIISNDIYWMLVRDAVIFPTGAKGTYNRLLMKPSLDSGVPGVAVLPCFSDKEVALIISYRHATRSWELEVPRGAKKPGETIETALMRELAEETGLVAKEYFPLGTLSVDSGVACNIVPVYLAKVEKRGVANQDYSEAILRYETFTLSQIREALAKGYVEVDIHGKKEKVNVRDSYITYALFLAETKKFLM